MGTYINNCLKIIKCPICGEYLVDKADKIDYACGLHYYHCEDCNIIIRIEENKG